MTFLVPHFLASAAPPSDSARSASEVIPWLILFIGMVLIGGVLIFAIRKWMKGDGGVSQVGFTLQDLREMHARGELSDAEFQAARAAMIGRLASSDQPSAVSGQPAAGSEGPDANKEHPDSDRSSPADR